MPSVAPNRLLGGNGGSTCDRPNCFKKRTLAVTGLGKDSTTGQVQLRKDIVVVENLHTLTLTRGNRGKKLSMLETVSR
jgi:hypothetical protein